MRYNKNAIADVRTPIQLLEEYLFNPFQRSFAGTMSAVAVEEDGIEYLILCNRNKVPVLELRIEDQHYILMRPFAYVKRMPISTPNKKLYHVIRDCLIAANKGIDTCQNPTRVSTKRPTPTAKVLLNTRT